jgi:Calcineurin-like phosphoesterase
MMLQDESGPFDIIGDVHGCLDELVQLLGKLGYQVADGNVTSTQGRRVIFLGDLVNRGPNVPGVLRLVMGMMAQGSAFCVAGNHDVALMQKLQGRAVAKEDDLVESLAQLSDDPLTYEEVASFIESLPAYLIFDSGRLVVSHAGLPEEYHGDRSVEALDFAVNGRKIADATGREARYRWWEDYHGQALVVYGHYSQEQPRWLNDTVCIDTGCVYGGRLTALRYPERELVSVSAARAYHETKRSPQFRAVALQP